MAGSGAFLPQLELVLWPSPVLGDIGDYLQRLGCLGWAGMGVATRMHGVAQDLLPCFLLMSYLVPQAQVGVDDFAPHYTKEQ